MSEHRLPCGCYAEPLTVNEGGYVVTAISFLCERRHKQGDVSDELPVVHPDQTSLDDPPPS